MNGKLAIGLVVGIVTGLMLGILFAPRKGSETRDGIVKKGEELSQGIKVKFHQLGDFISEKLDSTKGVYRNFISIQKLT